MCWALYKHSKYFIAAGAHRTLPVRETLSYSCYRWGNLSLGNQNDVGRPCDSQCHSQPEGLKSLWLQVPGSSVLPIGEECLLDQRRSSSSSTQPIHAGSRTLKDCLSTFTLGLPCASCYRALGRAGGILMEHLLWAAALQLGSALHPMVSVLLGTLRVSKGSCVGWCCVVSTLYSKAVGAECGETVPMVVAKSKRQQRNDWMTGGRGLCRLQGVSCRVHSNGSQTQHL